MDPISRELIEEIFHILKSRLGGMGFVLILPGHEEDHPMEIISPLDAEELRDFLGSVMETIQDDPVSTDDIQKRN